MWPESCIWPKHNRPMRAVRAAACNIGITARGSEARGLCVRHDVNCETTTSAKLADGLQERRLIPENADAQEVAVKAALLGGRRSKRRAKSLRADVGSQVLPRCQQAHVTEPPVLPSQACVCDEGVHATTPPQKCPRKRPAARHVDVSVLSCNSSGACVGYGACPVPHRRLGRVGLRAQSLASRRKHVPKATSETATA